MYSDTVAKTVRRDKTFLFILSTEKVRAELAVILTNLTDLLHSPALGVQEPAIFIIETLIQV